MARRLSSTSLPVLPEPLRQAILPYIELFADVDDVFSEDDALSPEKRQMGMGRIYRSWKRVRAQLDEDYDEAHDDRD